MLGSCIVAQMCYTLFMNTITKTAFVRARIEPSVKRKAESVMRKIGISPSEAINVFYQRVANEQGIPFSLNIPNAKTRKAIKDIKEGKGRVVSFETFAKEMRNIAS